MPLHYSTGATVQPVKTLNSFDAGLLFELPGYGSKRDDCGAPIYLAHPASGGKLHWIRRAKTCHRKECPVCWPDWQKREALSIQDRLSAYYRIKHRYPVHYVISPPQDAHYDTKPTYRALRSKAYQIAKLRGIRGGVMIFHTRNSRRRDDAYLKAHCSEGPHFHIIGDGWLSARVKEFYLADGWIVKNLRIRKVTHVYGTASYILDHAAIAHGYPANSHSSVSELSSVTWFGTMSYNKMPKERFVGSDVIFCPICKVDVARDLWVAVDWNGLGPPPSYPVWGVGRRQKWLYRPAIPYCVVWLLSIISPWVMTQSPG